MLGEINSNREAMTLVELLVVMTILLVLATLSVLVVSAVHEQDRVGWAASQVQGWLQIARQRALRDRRPVGIRLMPSADDPTICRELRYIEQPDDLNLGTMRIESNHKDLTFLESAAELGSGSDPDQWVVQPGDFLESPIFSTSPLFRIENVVPASKQITVKRKLKADKKSGGKGKGPRFTTDYRIVRSPRPLLGEPALLLPMDTLIDLAADRSIMIPDIRPSGSTHWDIVFAPSGEMIRRHSVSGRVILWLRSHSTPDPASGTHVLIGIQTRTGWVAVQPVDPSGANPYSSLQDVRWVGGM